MTYATYTGYVYEKRFKWRCKTPFKQRRLDSVLISDSLQDLVNAIEMIHSVQSDHSALQLKISSLTEGSKGPSYWKFNNTSISDEEYVNNMKSKIPEFCRESLVLQRSGLALGISKIQNETLLYESCKTKGT